MTSAAAASPNPQVAAATFFGIEELVALTIPHLPHRDLLTIQRVTPACRRAVQRSSASKRKLFLSASTTTEMASWRTNPHRLIYAKGSRSSPPSVPVAPPHHLARQLPILPHYMRNIAQEQWPHGPTDRTIVEMNRFLCWEADTDPKRFLADSYHKGIRCDVCFLNRTIRDDIFYVVNPALLSIDPASTASCLDMFLTRPPVPQIMIRMFGSNFERNVVAWEGGVKFRHIVEHVRFAASCGYDDPRCFVRLGLAFGMMEADKEWLAEGGEEGRVCVWEKLRREVKESV